MPIDAFDFFHNASACSKHTRSLSLSLTHTNTHRAFYNLACVIFSSSYSFFLFFPSFWNELWAFVYFFFFVSRLSYRFCCCFCGARSLTLCRSWHTLWITTRIIQQPPTFVLLRSRRVGRRRLRRVTSTICFEFFDTHTHTQTFSARAKIFLYQSNEEIWFWRKKDPSLKNSMLPIIFASNWKWERNELLMKTFLVGVYYFWYILEPRFRSFKWKVKIFSFVNTHDDKDVWLIVIKVSSTSSVFNIFNV